MKNCSIEKIIVLDPAMKQLVGHHHAWNTVLQKSLDGLGIQHQFFFFHAFSKENLTLYHNASPHFLYNAHQMPPESPDIDSAEKFMLHAFTMYQDLLRIEQLVNEKTLVLAHTATASMMLGISLWFAALPEKNRPHLALNVHFLWEPPTEWTRKSYAIAAKNFNHSPKVRLYGVPDHVVSMLHEATGMPVSRLPMPFGFEAPDIPGKDDKLVFGIAGAALMTKNINLLPRAVEGYFTSGGRGRFILHSAKIAGYTAADETLKQLIALAQRHPDKCTVITHGIYGEEYYQLLRQFSVALVLHSPEVYHKFRPSQFFQEATYLGIPSIVSKCGYLQYETEKLGNGSIMLPELTSQCLVDALLEFDRSAQARIKAAQVAGGRYREENNLGAFWRFLLDEPVQMAQNKEHDYTLKDSELPPDSDSRSRSMPSFSTILKPAAILGNGPSLKGFDFHNELHGYATFGMNAAYRFWDRIHWYPNYYSCLDEVVGLSHKEEIRRLIERADEFALRGFLLRDNLIRELGSVGLGPKVTNFEQLLKNCPSLFDTMHKTTGSHTLAWAAYLGYRDIVLLGMDCNYVPVIEGALQTGIILEMIKTPERNPNYFFDDYQRQGDRYHIPNPQSNPDKATHLLVWRQLKEPLKNYGVCVINANPASKVDAFPKCRFEGLEAALKEERAKIPAPAFAAPPASRVPVSHPQPSASLTPLQKSELEAQHQAELAKQKSELEAQHQAELAKMNRDYVHSLSWRLTRPLRAVGKVFLNRR